METVVNTLKMIAVFLTLNYLVGAIEHMSFIW